VSVIKYAGAEENIILDKSGEANRVHHPRGVFIEDLIQPAVHSTVNIPQHIPAQHIPAQKTTGMTRDVDSRNGEVLDLVVE